MLDAPDCCEWCGRELYLHRHFGLRQCSQWCGILIDDCGDQLPDSLIADLEGIVEECISIAKGRYCTIVHYGQLTDQIFN